MVDNPSMPVVLAYFGFIFAGFASIFVGIGVWQAVHQATCLETYIPVTAQVESNDIETGTGRAGGGRRNYTPKVIYTYRLGDFIYRRSQVQPIEESGSWATAQAVLRRFPVGATVTAYRSPSDPGSAFLFRKSSVMPYVYMLVPMLQVVFGLVIALFCGFPPASKAGQASRMLIIAVIVWLVTGFAVTHYVLHCRPLYLREGIAFGVIVSIDIGLLMLWRWMVPPPPLQDHSDKR
jgi:hypothetical protein